MEILFALYVSSTPLPTKGKAQEQDDGDTNIRTKGIRDSTNDSTGMYKLFSHTTTISSLLFAFIYLRCDVMERSYVLVRAAVQVYQVYYCNQFSSNVRSS